jgi:hypothetical protein|tara:strand:+ start:516 stop:680 length:165 start_codon:yes stop_codon:yes gene_type:complete
MQIELTEEQAQKIVAALADQIDELEWYHTVHADYASIDAAQELQALADQITAAL